MKTKSIKAIGLLLALFLSGTFLRAQEITGQWNGVLSVPGMNLKLVFHIEKTDEGYASTMDSPDQGVTAIPVATTLFDGTVLSLKIPNIGMQYEGTFKTDSIVGVFKQSGMSFPLTLKKTETEISTFVRPQEPKPPYSYRSEDIAFENKEAGITLSGTLTMPSAGDNFTAAILITGSGAQNRDEEIMGHKPFLVIADYLTQHGIAVLRYDDRGTAQSAGDFSTATTADFASDATHAVEYLKTRKEINSLKIGLIGHSEGGVIAPMLATRSKDIAFIVMLAGTGVSGDALLLLQQEAIYRASGVPEEQIAEIVKINAKIFDKIISVKENLSKQEITDFITTLETDIVSGGMSMDNYNQFAEQVSTPWIQYFIRYNPAPTLEKVKCPVLAVNGAKDLQVPAKENLTAIDAALKKGGNTKVTIKEYPDLNHLFQKCDTGLLNEYAAIEQTFSPEVLNDLCEWILKQ
jgi:dienelactone hydrolase